MEFLACCTCLERLAVYHLVQTRTSTVYPPLPLCNKVRKLLLVNRLGPPCTGMTPDHRQDKLIRYTPKKEVFNWSNYHTFDVLPPGSIQTPRCKLSCWVSVAMGDNVCPVRCNNSDLDTRYHLYTCSQYWSCSPCHSKGPVKDCTAWLASGYKAVGYLSI